MCDCLHVCVCMYVRVCVCVCGCMCLCLCVSACLGVFPYIFILNPGMSTSPTAEERQVLNMLIPPRAF